MTPVGKSRARFVASVAIGMAMSIFAFCFAWATHKDWTAIPQLPGFLLAAITPGIGVHSDNRYSFPVLAISVNAICYAVAVYWLWSVVTYLRKGRRSD
jgi:hypothetical protein